LIPSALAAQLEQGLRDFLLTSFDATTPGFDTAIQRLLHEPGRLLKGPHLQVALPFVRGSRADWFPTVPLPFTPHKHQEAAFARLGGKEKKSTLVATGTGSGKSESFLWPILAHCEAHASEPGIKAILIYPMNALATDQALRVARAIHGSAHLEGKLRAGLYIGLNTPGFLLNFVRQRRGKRVEAQLMDAMVLLSNSLKSGLDIVQGFELVARDLVPPISEEVGLVIKNYQLGTTFERALEGMEDRVASRLMSYVIKAIVIQRTVGGNLTKIFDRIVENIREEGKLEEKMQALTAQQRIQSMVVGFMPWAMVVMMSIFQPETMAAYYFSPLGVLTIVFCAFWMSIGMGIVRKLSNIQV